MFQKYIWSDMSVKKLLFLIMQFNYFDWMFGFQNGGEALDFSKVQLKYWVVVKVLLLQGVRRICVHLRFTPCELFR